MSLEQDDHSDYKHPIFFGASVVTFGLSMVCQVFFFVLLSGIFSEKETATDIIQAVLEWMLLLAPSLSLASIFFLLFFLCYGMSWYRRESTHRFMIPLGIFALIDAIIFFLVFTFGYQQ